MIYSIFGVFEQISLEGVAFSKQPLFGKDIEQESEDLSFFSIIVTSQEKEEVIDEDAEVDIDNLEDTSILKASNGSYGGLRYLAAVPSPEQSEQQDKYPASPIKQEESNNSASPFDMDVVANGHASSPMEGKLYCCTSYLSVLEACFFVPHCPFIFWVSLCFELCMIVFVGFWIFVVINGLCSANYYPDCDLGSISIYWVLISFGIQVLGVGFCVFLYHWVWS